MDYKTAVRIQAQYQILHRDVMDVVNERISWLRVNAVTDVFLKVYDHDIWTAKVGVKPCDVLFICRHKQKIEFFFKPARRMLPNGDFETKETDIGY